MKDSRDFAQLPLGRLIACCALPAMVSMSAMALYSVIDGVFVGYFLGAASLAAINLVFPLFMLFSAVIDMIAAGSSVQIATRLGAGRQREASRIFSFSLVAIFLVSIAVAAIVFVGTRPLLALMGAEPVVIEQAATYLYILAAGAPIGMFFFATDNYLRICGWQNYSMALNVGVALLNIALDYLFIVPLGWGIAGAALATTLGIGLGALLSFVPFLLRRTELRFVRGTIPWRQFRKLAFNGSSDFFDSTASSVMDLVVNTVLLQIGGTLAVAAFSVVMYLDSVVSMLVFGLTSSLQPALSYCHGARLRAHAPFAESHHGDGRRAVHGGVRAARAGRSLGADVLHRAGRHGAHGAVASGALDLCAVVSREMGRCLRVKLFHGTRAAGCLAGAVAPRHARCAARCTRNPRAMARAHGRLVDAAVRRRAVSSGIVSQFAKAYFFAVLLTVGQF